VGRADLGRETYAASRRAGVSGEREKEKKRERERERWESRAAYVTDCT